MQRLKDTKTRLILKDPMIWIAVMAAILYCSWPLGFLLNPSVAHHAFASQLEASGQPYNWLFITLDVLSGLALIIGGILQWRRSRQPVIRLSIIAYVVFALLVIVAAVVPYNCDSLATSCDGIAHTPLSIIHGSASIMSAVFLFFCLTLLLKIIFKKYRLHWFTMLGLMVVSFWGVLGVIALIVNKTHHADENIVQDMFMTLCSLSVILSVVVIEYLLIISKKPRKNH